MKKDLLFIINQNILQFYKLKKNLELEAYLLKNQLEEANKQKHPDHLCNSHLVKMLNYKKSIQEIFIILVMLIIRRRYHNNKIIHKKK